MTQQHAATALLQVAIRRRLVSMKEALSLRHVLAGCDSDPQAIRARLAHNPEQVSGETVEALRELLPAPDQEIIGPYRRLALLGHSPVGQTWLGLGSEQFVVLETIDPQLIDEDLTKEIVSDTTPLLQGKLRYLVTYLGWEQSAEHGLTLVNEYRAGRDANERHLIKGESSEIRTLTLLRHATKGLAQLHQLGRSHGNLCPQNILLDNDGRGALSNYALGSTPTGMRRGWTPERLKRLNFAAPEECQDQPTTNAASDIYAIGCIGYWLLTGQAPFPGTAEIQRLQHQHADRPDVRTLAVGVSELTAKTLTKAMQIDPAARYPHARALLVSLERNLELLESPQPDTEVKMRQALVGGDDTTPNMSLEST